MTPLNYYQQQCDQGLIENDEIQLAVMHAMQPCFEALVAECKQRQSIFRVLRQPKLVKGLYLYGGVGIGKTFMMDCFYKCLPFKEKKRMHFHQFMRMVHQELKKAEGRKNPLDWIARNLSEHILLLCLDEFLVNDIVDAMLLARLLQSLFDHGVCVVATSNTEPDNLYLKGLQRPSFLPAIALIKQNMTVIPVVSQMDYRLRHVAEMGVFHIPNDQAARDHMEESFALLTPHDKPHGRSIELYGRVIAIQKQAGDVIWFDFSVICAPPRSQLDYLTISEQYKTVFVSDVPAILPGEYDKILLFIRMIDVFYDAGVRLVLSAAVPIDKIYTEGRLLAEFNRTRSRLMDMQSKAYFTMTKSY